MRVIQFPAHNKWRALLSDIRNTADTEFFIASQLQVRRVSAAVDQKGSGWGTTKSALLQKNTAVVTNEYITYKVVQPRQKLSKSHYFFFGPISFKLLYFPTTILIFLPLGLFHILHL